MLEALSLCACNLTLLILFFPGPVALLKKNVFFLSVVNISINPSQSMRTNVLIKLSNHSYALCFILSNST